MKKIKTTLSIILMICVVSGLASKIPEDTILAKFEGGKIIMKQVTERIEQIPPMYRTKYNSEQGKKDVLEMIAVEELFYLEAITQNVKSDSRFISRESDQLKSVYFNSYKKEFLANNVNISDEELKAYFDKNPDFFKEQTFEDSKPNIKRRIQPEKEKEVFNKKKEELIAKYNIVINQENLNTYDLEKADMNTNKNTIIIDSSNPEFKLTTAKLAELFEYMPERNKQAIITHENLKTYLENRIELDIFYGEAIAAGYDKKESIKIETEQAERTLMLRTIYNQLVVDEIDLSDEALEKFYNENIEQFSSKPYRKIQTFGFDDEATAKKMKKVIKKLVKKNKREELLTFIKENSVYPDGDGVIDHIYQNKIIPRLGKDEVYADAVWNAKADSTKLSETIKNSKDKFVFLRVLEDHLAEPTPFEEVKSKIKSNKMKTLSKEKFEFQKKQLAEKYNLVKYSERLVVVLTAKEYFDKAEESQKNRRFKDAVNYYDQVILHHKNNKDDYKALFMKGFLYAEELKNTKEAIEIFGKVIKDFPAGDLHESAEFMIKELNGENEPMENFEE